MWNTDKDRENYRKEIEKFYWLKATNMADNALDKTLKGLNKVKEFRKLQREYYEQLLDENIDDLY